jgi:diaminopimelate decarboxylase/aspartate kinase
VSDFVILKFGGTSVKSRARWETIRDVVRARVEAGERPVLVCSAVSQVTNTLERLVDAAVRGDHAPIVAELRERHRDLAGELEVSPSLVDPLLDSLEKLALGASLVREVSPRLHAKILAHGELLSTTLGAAFLKGQGLKSEFVDVRDHMRAIEEEHAGERRRILNAACDDAPEPEVQAAFEALEGEVLVTQGFLARNDDGDTVLLGRGGSDTSAAYLAAKLAAKRCEIWTDVPGVYSANPRDIPSARLLRGLDYDEAQEIASTGAKVLHPRCIAPCRRGRIPLWIKCSTHPEIDGTRIEAGVKSSGARVKAISEKHGVVLLSMNTLGMWQQVGFLADIFATFKRHGVSIDVVSTSESNVTVTLDKLGTGLDDRVLDALLEDLNKMCKTRVIPSCSAISLVGQRIRAILHQLGPVMRVFEERKVHLVSQAASDLNLTFVVDEDNADRIVKRLHALLFDDADGDPLLGPSWREVFGEEERKADTSEPRWWENRREELLKVAAEETPVYVYDAPTIEARAKALAGLKSVDRVFFAMKANPHPEVLRRVTGAGLGLECVSPGELAHVKAQLPDLDPSRVLYTPNFASRDEYRAGLDAGVNLTVDNLHPLSAWGDIFAGREIFLRLDPGRGRGHHAHVRTAGKQSKFGIAPDQVDEVRAAAERCGAKVVGLHVHAGSGIRDATSWRETAAFLVEQAARFPHVRRLDLGGGLGVVERPGQSPLDLSVLDAGLAEVRAAHEDFFKDRGGLEIWMEPGRYLVSEAGVLLGTVTQLKQKGEVRYIGSDVGMNSLIRPALYGAFHEIVNLTKVDEPRRTRAHVVGPICETGDTLGHGRVLPETDEGDVLLFGTAGAYGRVMSSRYNLREPAVEKILE